MKNKIKELMLEEIFVKTGGRKENPQIADLCAEIAMKFISENGILPSDETIDKKWFYPTDKELDKAARVGAIWTKDLALGKTAN